MEYSGLHTPLALSMRVIEIFRVFMCSPTLCYLSGRYTLRFLIYSLCERSFRWRIVQILLMLVFTTKNVQHSHA